MNKALIEKAFEKWLDNYKSRSRCTHLDAFIAGVEWRDEQIGRCKTCKHYYQKNSCLYWCKPNIKPDGYCSEYEKGVL